jgi:hypothetical protein
MVIGGFLELAPALLPERHNPEYAVRMRMR